MNYLWYFKREMKLESSKYLKSKIQEPKIAHCSKHSLSLDHSPFISIVLYRVTLMQDPVLAYFRAAASCARLRLKPVLVLRLLCKRLFYGRAMNNFWAITSGWTFWKPYITNMKILQNLLKHWYTLYITLPWITLYVVFEIMSSKAIFTHCVHVVHAGS